MATGATASRRNAAVCDATQHQEIGRSVAQAALALRISRPDCAYSTFGPLPCSGVTLMARAWPETLAGPGKQFVMHGFLRHNAFSAVSRSSSRKFASLGIRMVLNVVAFNSKSSSLM